MAGGDGAGSLTHESSRGSPRFCRKPARRGPSGWNRSCARTSPRKKPLFAAGSKTGRSLVRASCSTPVLEVEASQEVSRVGHSPDRNGTPGQAEGGVLRWERHRAAIRGRSPKSSGGLRP